MTPSGDMIDLFISYKREERDFARRLFDDLKPFLRPWFDTSLEIENTWRAVLSRQLSEASCQVTLWSPKATESKFILSEASQALNEAKQIDALLSPCEIPLPFGQRGVVDLTGWRVNPEDIGKWDLLRKVAEVLRDGALEQYAIQEILAHQDSDNANTIEYFDYSELSACCDALRDEVRGFDPDVIFAPHARSGIWAEIFFDFLQYRVPVVIGSLAADGNLSGYTLAGNDMIPNLLKLKRPNERVLVVCDRITRDHHCFTLDNVLQSEFGFAAENIRFIGLVGHEDMVGSRFRMGKISAARDLVLFYDMVELND
ncbi:MAG: toll/interleukin-1 receptor domain-containing protein [Pseudomonadota bacterium]